MSKKVAIFDSSLRDGAQAEGISFSVEDKLKILELLDGHGVDYIEAGNPGSNPKDLEFFARARAIKLKHAKLAGVLVTLFLLAWVGVVVWGIYKLVS